MRMISTRDAERICGSKLDGRGKYAIDDDGQVLRLCMYAVSCSGCHETIDGYEHSGTEYDKNGVALGSGCSECGYTGKRRVRDWVHVEWMEGEK